MHMSGLPLRTEGMPAPRGSRRTRSASYPSPNAAPTVSASLNHPAAVRESTHIAMAAAIVDLGYVRGGAVSVATVPTTHASHNRRVRGQTAANAATNNCTAITVSTARATCPAVVLVDRAPVGMRRFPAAVSHPG